MAPSLTPIVVDNASTDGTLERVCARKIANAKNRGFAAAVNQGVRATDAEFLLLLNPDVNLLTAVDSLMGASRQYGLAAGQLIGADGHSQAGFTIRRFPTPASLIFELFGINRLWPSNRVNRHYRYLDRPLDQAGPVEQPAGAFLMFRRDVWEKLGGFDEKFRPIWFEDVDFCRRAADAGFRIEYLPNVQGRHEGAHSIRGLEPGCRAWYWCVSLLRYAAKHFDWLGYRAVCAAVLVSSLPRMVAGMIEQRSLTPILVYSRIVRFAGLCLGSSRRRGVVPPNS
jgi:N-acetylglucosaminyl-diphospho-decaprenol L-rhamnosyltransferase